MGTTMRAARLHVPCEALRIDEIAVPVPRPEVVMVRVRACGVIPNMNASFSGALWNHLPELPAVVGLDAACEVAAVAAIDALCHGGVAINIGALSEKLALELVKTRPGGFTNIVVCPDR